MQKIGKYISTILIINLIITGVILSFHVKEAKYSFYFFGTAVLLTMVFSLFIFLGNVYKNKALVLALHNAISKPETIPLIIDAIKGRPVIPPYPQPPIIQPVSPPVVRI